MDKYIVRNSEDGTFLQALSLSRTSPSAWNQSLTWTPDLSLALTFEAEEAGAVIYFISEVWSFDLAEKLEAQEVEQ